MKDMWIEEIYRYLSIKEVDAAQALIYHLLDKFPKDAAVVIAYADVLEASGDYESALEKLSHYLSLYPESYGVKLRKAELLCNEFDRIPEARVLLEQLEKDLLALDADYDPLLVEVYLLLTECCEARTDFERALEIAQQVYTLAPKDERAIYALSHAYFINGKIFEAHKTGILCKEQVDTHWLLGRIELAMGNNERALEYFRYCTLKEPSRFFVPKIYSDAVFLKRIREAIDELPESLRKELKNRTINVLTLPHKKRLSPTSLCDIEPAKDNSPGVLIFFKNNIVALARTKKDYKELITSLIVHKALE